MDAPTDDGADAAATCFEPAYVADLAVDREQVERDVVWPTRG
jgi:hypothetical protein